MYVNGGLIRTQFTATSWPEVPPGTGSGNSAAFSSFFAGQPVRNVVTQAFFQPVVVGGATPAVFEDAGATGPAIPESGLTSSGGGWIWFFNTLDGGRDVQVSTGGLAAFSANVGGVTPLTSLTTDLLNGVTWFAPAAAAAGPVTPAGAISVTTASGQTYHDPVWLFYLNTTFADVSAGNITFDNTLGGTSNVVVDTAGVTRFNGIVGVLTVGTLTVASAPLVSLTVNDPGSVVINCPSVITTLSQTYNVPATLGMDTVLTSQQTDVTFGQTLDGPFTLTIDAARNVSLNGDAGGVAPLAALTINAGNVVPGVIGNISLDGVTTFSTPGADQTYNVWGAGGQPGKISLHSTYTGYDISMDTHQSTPPEVATIYDAAGNVVFLAAHDFTMTTDDKLTVIGNLTINAANAVQIGDLSASGDIHVVSPSIGLLTRPAGLVLLPNGTLKLDSGVDYIARHLEFSTTPHLIGSGPLPEYATSTGLVINPGPGIVRLFAVTAADLKLASDPAVILDGIAMGPSNTNPRTSYGDDLPPLDLPPPIAPPPAPGPADIQDLEQLGIFVQPQTFDEWLLSLDGRWFYDDTPAALPPLKPQDYRISSGRLSAELVAAVLDDYRKLFWAEVSNSQTGGKERKYLGPELKKLFQDGFDAYKAQGVTFRAKFDSASFASFLYDKYARADEAANAATQLAVLLDEIQLLGLTPAEFSSSESVLLSKIVPAGMSLRDFEAVIQVRNVVQHGH